MLQDIPTPALRERRSCILETERLMLRRPTLPDADRTFESAAALLAALDPAARA